MALRDYKRAERIYSYTKDIQNDGAYCVMKRGIKTKQKSKTE